MRLIQAQELSRMRQAQAETLNDTIQHIRRQTATNEYGQPDVTWVLAESYACGFQPVAKPEAMNDTEVPLVDAKLRLPLTLESTIAHTDRVKLTHRFGEALADPQTYEIVGLPERGPSGLVYNLKRVTDGSGV